VTIKLLSIRRTIVAACLATALAGCATTAVTPTPGPTNAPVTQATIPPLPTVAPQATAQPATTAQPGPTAQPGQPLPTTPDGTPRRISFAPGATSAAVEGAVVRGTRDRYVLWAAAGQEMRVSLASLEQNGALVIIAPGGAALPGAEPGADAKAWSGTLPAAGDYTLEVGPTRGNATYRLEVSITTPAAPAGAIRSTDWAALLANDPAFYHEPQPDGRTYLRLRLDGEQVGGIPLLDNVVYGDFDGDAREEAAITLASGGTAGNVGLLVYRQGAAGPELAAWRNGYKLWAAAENSQLVVREPIYAGWEANCCPTGLSTARYLLGPSGLQAVDQRSEGVAEARPYVVEHFYDLLRAKDMAGAYALLGDAEQAANPFDAWAAGYANTLDLAVTAQADPARPEAVRVTIEATDATPDGGRVVRRFAGTWDVVWVTARPGYALINPQFQELP